MNKDRLIAFTDAILAIIMTILVLELQEPESFNLQGLWALKGSYSAYTLSFFWLETMWIGLHMNGRTWKKYPYRSFGITCPSSFSLRFSPMSLVVILAGGYQVAVFLALPAHMKEVEDDFI